MNEDYSSLKKFNDDLIRIFSRTIKLNNKTYIKEIYHFFKVMDEQLDKPIGDIIDLIVKEGKFIDINEFIQDISIANGNKQIENKIQLIDFFKWKFKDHKHLIFIEPLMYLLTWSNTYKALEDPYFYTDLNEKVKKILKKEFNAFEYFLYNHKKTYYIKNI